MKSKLSIALTSLVALTTSALVTHELIEYVGQEQQQVSNKEDRAPSAQDTIKVMGYDGTGTNPATEPVTVTNSLFDLGTGSITLSNIYLEPGDDLIEKITLQICDEDGTELHYIVVNNMISGIAEPQKGFSNSQTFDNLLPGIYTFQISRIYWFEEGSDLSTDALATDFDKDDPMLYLRDKDNNPFTVEVKDEPPGDNTLEVPSIIKKDDGNVALTFEASYKSRYGEKAYIILNDSNDKKYLSNNDGASNPFEESGIGQGEEHTIELHIEDKSNELATKMLDSKTITTTSGSIEFNSTTTDSLSFDVEGSLTKVTSNSETSYLEKAYVSLEKNSDPSIVQTKEIKDNSKITFDGLENGETYTAKLYTKNIAGEHIFDVGSATATTNKSEKSTGTTELTSVEPNSSNNQVSLNFKADYTPRNDNEDYSGDEVYAILKEGNTQIGNPQRLNSGSNEVQFVIGTDPGKEYVAEIYTKFSDGTTETISNSQTVVTTSSGSIELNPELSTTNSLTFNLDSMLTTPELTSSNEETYVSLTNAEGNIVEEKSVENGEQTITFESLEPNQTYMAKLYTKDTEGNIYFKLDTTSGETNPIIEAQGSLSLKDVSAFTATFNIEYTHSINDVMEKAKPYIQIKEIGDSGLGEIESVDGKDSITIEGLESNTLYEAILFESLDGTVPDKTIDNITFTTTEHRKEYGTININNEESNPHTLAIDYEIIPAEIYGLPEQMFSLAIMDSSGVVIEKKDSSIITNDTSKKTGTFTFGESEEVQLVPNEIYSVELTHIWNDGGTPSHPKILDIIKNVKTPEPVGPEIGLEIEFDRKAKYLAIKTNTDTRDSADIILNVDVKDKDGNSLDSSLKPTRSTNIDISSGEQIHQIILTNEEDYKIANYLDISYSYTDFFSNEVLGQTSFTKIINETELGFGSAVEIDNSLSTGIIVGIIFGSLVAIIAIGGGSYWLIKNKKPKSIKKPTKKSKKTIEETKKPIQEPKITTEELGEKMEELGIMMEDSEIIEDSKIIEESEISIEEPAKEPGEEIEEIETTKESEISIEEPEEEPEEEIEEIETTEELGSTLKKLGIRIEEPEKLIQEPETLKESEITTDKPETLIQEPEALKESETTIDKPEAPIQQPEAPIQEPGISQEDLGAPIQEPEISQDDLGTTEEPEPTTKK